MTPQAYCEKKVRQSASSFYYSFLFLNQQQRNAMMALYAFCREIDDIVDQQSDVEIAQTKLNWWKTEIHSAFKHQANHPIALAISHNLKFYTFNMDYFLGIIHGMEMDLTHNGYKTQLELENYCYHVAGAVGLLTIEIMGYHKKNIKQIQNFAKNLALALQLINIIRDIQEDFNRQRIYIPSQLMEQFSVTADTLLKKNNPNTIALLNNLSLQADKYYQQALDNLSDEDRYFQRSALIMAKIYFSLLHKIQRSHYANVSKRISLHPIYKLWLAWSTARKESKREQKRLQKLN